jgi:hypothetical protein
MLWMVLLGWMLLFANQSEDKSFDFKGIRGVIVDPADRSIPGAEILLHNLETGKDRQLRSGLEGEFQFSDCLEDGAYRLTVSIPGFITTSLDKVLYHYPNKIDLHVRLNIDLSAPGFERISTGDLLVVETTDSDTKLPVALVDIEVIDNGTSTVVTTDACGKEWRLLRPGNYVIIARKTGYERRVVTLKMQGSENLTIPLDRQIAK